jgi:hypothetical protein
MYVLLFCIEFVSIMICTLMTLGGYVLTMLNLTSPLYFVMLGIGVGAITLLADRLIDRKTKSKKESQNNQTEN